MTTNEEFQKALELMTACKATIACGCKVDPDYAEYLFRQCKDYIELFNKRFK